MDYEYRPLSLTEQRHNDFYVDAPSVGNRMTSIDVFYWKLSLLTAGKP